MTVVFTRRAALLAGAGGALAAFVARPLAAFADNSVETHGLSSFGDLALPPDFPHFAYVNPEAPKGGLLSLQITATGGNQNFDTFDTLNMLSAEGRRRGRHVGDFRHADDRQRRRARFGLWPARPRPSAYSADKLDYRFLPAPRGALLRRLEGDRGRRRLLAQHAEGEGPSDLRAASQARSRARARRPTTSSTCASSRTAAATPI